MPNHGKQYRDAEAKIENRLYTPKSAMQTVKDLSFAKFDETVEASIRLGVDTRKADQNVRGSISLPHGTGKSVRVAVFAEGEKAREAEEAGADVVGGDELVAAIQAGNIDFDAAIEACARITPVPRGIGSVSTAVLLRHVVTAAEAHVAGGTA